MASTSPTTTTSNTQPTTPPILRISPQTFQFSASKVSSGLVSKLKIKNLQPTPVGYKFKTNAPLRYSVKPVLGVLVPGQSIEVFVRCESWVNPQDRFLLQSVGLTEEESQYIDATTWKELDRRRIIESFIQCSSSSTLTMREPQDDGGSISSTSSNSSTRSSVVSSTRSSSGLSDKSRELRSQQQQAVRSNNRSPLVSTAKLQGRKMSSSSATSSNSSSPGSYPTLFQAKQPTNATKTETKSRDLKEKDLASTHAPLALFAAPVHYLHTKVSNSKQTVRTLTRFLAVRQYTKMQVFTVSMVCLLLGLLLPMEKLMMMLGGNSMQNHASSGPTAIPKALFSGVSPLASPLSQKPPVIVVPVSQRPKVVSPVMEEEEAAPPTTAYLPKVEDLLAQDGPSSQEAIEPEPIGAL